MVFKRRWFGFARKQILVSSVLMIVWTIVLLGVAACQSAPVSPQISSATLLEQLQSGAVPLIIDVRSLAEYESSHIPGAIHIPHRDLSHHLDELAEFKTRPVVLYCEAGVRAGIAETTLVDAGFQQVIHLAGDMQEWRRKEFPVESHSSFP